jgi:hypothetical protein
MPAPIFLPASLPLRGQPLAIKQQAQLRRLLARCLEQALTPSPQTASQPVSKEVADEPGSHRS